MVGQQDEPDYIGLMLAKVGWSLVVAFVIGCVLWFLTHPIPPTFGKP